MRAAISAALLAGLAAGGAAAQTPPPGPVYLGLDTVGDRPRATFVFSDPERPGAFAPVAAYSVAPDAADCGIDYAADPQIAEPFRAAPLIDPAGAVIPQLLPVAVAEHVVGALRAMGEDRPEVLRAHQACVRRLWERIVGLRR